MKKIFAYYLLLLYTASLCKPFTIWFSDAMAHVYFSKQHTVVHQHNGDSHVHEEIGKAAKEDAPQEKKSAVKAQEDISFLHSINYTFLPSSIVLKTYHPAFDDALPEIFADISLPPPRTC